MQGEYEFLSTETPRKKPSDPADSAVAIFRSLNRLKASFCLI